MDNNLETRDDKPARYPLTFKLLASSFLLLQIAIIVLVVMMSGKGQKDNAPQGAGMVKKTPVTVTEVIPHAVTDMLEVPGSVESWASVEISAEVNGSIVFMGAEKGQKLEQGQIIMKIDDTLYMAEKKKYEAAMEFAKRNSDRKKKLYESKSVAEKEIEDALNLLTATVSEYEVAKVNLEKCEIRSNVNGYLDARPVEKGEFVNAGTPVATVEQVDRVKIVFYVPEKDVIFVKKDELMPFMLDAYPGKKFEGKVTFVAVAAEKASLSYRTELEVPNPDLLLRPGMIARVRIQRASIENAISIPLIAIMPRYEGYYVFVAGKDGKASLREIKAAFISGTNVVIEKGLSPGELVVVEGQRLLSENDPLDIVGREENR